MTDHDPFEKRVAEEVEKRVTTEFEKRLAEALAEAQLKNINPDDAKYAGTTAKLSPYLSADAEWRMCARVQRALLATRVEFGKAPLEALAEVDAALPKLSPLNMSRLETKVTRHDQLAVLEELGNYISPETKALLHPGTTSYDVLDTARSFLFREAWKEVMRPKVFEVIGKLCDKAEEHAGLVQAGRTHLQDTSPVDFGGVLASYAARMADCRGECDGAFGRLRGKISGIVGTGASIDVVIGEGTALAFERAVLEKLGLEPDPTASQIVQKERLLRVGSSIIALMGVAANLANHMRILYSSGIGEVKSVKSAERLGGSSADAGKDNPIEPENIAGKYAIVASGMGILVAQMETDLQRDLRNSVQARYEPQLMMARTYESYCRLSKELDQLTPQKEAMGRNLQRVRDMPTEAMTAVTRAHQYVHPAYGLGHDAVKEFAKQAKREGRPLLAVALGDAHFKAAYETWPELHRKILRGGLEDYLGCSREKARENIRSARNG